MYSTSKVMMTKATIYRIVLPISRLAFGSVGAERSPLATSAPLPRAGLTACRFVGNTFSGPLPGAFLFYHKAHGLSIHSPAASAST